MERKYTRGSRIIIGKIKLLNYIVTNVFNVELLVISCLFTIAMKFQMIKTRTEVVDALTKYVK
jgi:hypothetical protein